MSLEIFDADLDSLTNERNMIPVVKGTAGDVSHQVLSSLIQLRYLVDSNLASLGKKILHSLGKILGWLCVCVCVCVCICVYLYASHRPKELQIMIIDDYHF